MDPLVFQSHIGLIDLVRTLSKAIDLISPRLRNHHFQVAYLSARLCRHLELDSVNSRVALIAALVHDIGGLSSRDVQDRLTFDDDGGDIFTHARVGSALLSSLDLFRDVAPVVRYHHEPWAFGRGSTHKGGVVPKLSHILHLADRIQILVDPLRPVLEQVPSICERIKPKAGSVFVPEYVDAFMNLSLREEFWLSMLDDGIFNNLHDDFGPFAQKLDPKKLLDVARFFGRVIDTRSEYTASHSAGVAGAASAMCRLAGFSETECFAVQVAGHLHDIGKLAVPREILEKPGKLDDAEWAIMRTHSFHTHRVLSSVAGLETIASWAAKHHERLNGEGYPFHSSSDTIPLPTRILAVADIFTAVKEDRPYRGAMSNAEALNVLRSEVEAGRIDRRVVDLLAENLDEIDRAGAISRRESRSWLFPEAPSSLSPRDDAVREPFEMACP